MARKITKTAILLVFSFFILSGCQQTTHLANVTQNVNAKIDEVRQRQEDKIQATLKCQELCQNQLTTDGQNFDIGQCLSNEIIADWVCDIAHSPRQAIDDDPANQCSAFRTGRAQHFVEVDGNCNVIKVY